MLARGLLVAGLAFVACVVAQLIGFEQRLILWPAGGIALAFAWRHGVRWLLPAALGAGAWAGFEWSDLGLGIGAAAVTAAGPAIAIRLLRRLGDWKPADYRLEAVLRFLGVVLLVAAPVDAALAMLVMGALDPIGGVSAADAFVAWWLIDSLGMLLLTPALLAFINEGLAEPEPSAAAAAVLDAPAVLATLAMLGASVLLSGIGERQYGFMVLFIYFPIVAWTAVRMSERAAALSLLATALPLLAVQAFEASQTPGEPLRAYVAPALVFSALLVALVLQAVAADRRFALARVARQAREDMTTGLLNDRGLLAELGERLLDPKRSHHGLVALHLNNFDTLNDLCGQLQAMQLEQSAAALLQRQPGLCFAARLSAGRYALLFHADSVAQVRTVAREIYGTLNGLQFRTEHGGLRLQASVGGLLVDAAVAINAEDCLQSLADALTIAGSVRDPQLFVEPLSQTMIDARRAHQGKVEQIREAIREQRFSLHAQPLVDPDAPAGTMSYEILIRLLDRNGQLVRPPEFLSLAVQAQMTVAMDRGVIERTFHWLRHHPDALSRTHKCSINLSGLTMSDGLIAAFIREQRALHDIPAHKIVFEITESEAIRNPAAASRLVDDLKSEGFGIALDDFGTGLATFEYLKRFPLDYLKIDGSFIRNLISNPIDEEIVLSTIRVARRLNVTTIAEHVHSQAIYDRLRELGVEHAQGDLISQPKPLDDLFGPSFATSVPPTGSAAARAVASPTRA